MGLGFVGMGICDGVEDCGCDWDCDDWGIGSGGLGIGLGGEGSELVWGLGCRVAGEDESAIVEDE